MSDTSKKHSGSRDRRQARLEQALRENLKKRKELARKRSAAEASDTGNDAAPPAGAPREG